MSANNTDMSKIKQVMRMMLQRDDRGKRPSNRKIGNTVGLYKVQMAVDGYRSGRCYGTGVMRCRNAIGRSVGTA